ncbi:putative Bacterial regulatory protein, LysR [Vibrio nigripulchritudo SFn27]|uniref:Putative Bacterial regulatory protein, LysR n=1 Tax=Vibrio nigripulchritudo TaxID=28173 RepID=U4KI93_9VIBR|nr:LysR family transcriptional regulator [Vibrio nigripulchritudo]CCN82416.1 putative Bacterial regulatory protein, LysR [Vibrio nigripulchritudo BLFn1]CCN91402.1 putative Bacterial regulatory protein, LysR [Vibrio nigripulchritudo SFn27]CCN97567.1 putative Bacterial regulatory protein, LysR [Vibrio nigripulchritudo ENn2]CCO38709.1 putative Bacterial regulatory protein, LysR [Vibrio nigripulchritudo SFn135]CCO55114.1 putative Bacterial regulatory protein, LysR [Vibrio nigripulchritudo Wn13]
MLDKMAFFVSVIRTGSISAAAREFELSVSAGSRWLQELEQHFGMTLCHRSNRLLTPTPAGQTLFDEFAPIVDNTEQIRRKLEGFQSETNGHINVACTPVYANHFLMDKISEYMKTHPKVTFNLNVTPWALDYSDKADLIISANAHYQGYRDRDVHLVRRELMSDPFIPVASPKYLEKHGKPNDPTDISEHQCLFATTLTGSNDWIFKKDKETLIVKVPKSLEVNDSDLLLQGVLKGAGIAYLPEFIVQPKLETGELVRLLDEYQTSQWSLNLYYQPQHKASPAAKLFKSFLLE